jgi:hypothetical protein
MTLVDSDMLLVGNGVSGDDSTTLLALVNAFVMLGSWSSYKKTPGGTIAQQEPSLANIASFCHPDMTTLCWPG